MEQTLINPGNIMFVINMIGILFLVYNSFRKPQIDAAQTDQAIRAQATLLEQRFQWNQDGIEKRFKEIQDNFQGLLLQSNNHIHTVDTKVDKLVDSIALMGNNVTKLSTIIEERIPKKP